MADYNLKAEITADASGYESGVKKAEKASKKLSTTISGVVKGLGKNGLVGALGAVGLASSGLSATLGSVVKVARKVSETMNECTNAYKTQLIAERSLDTAIQNNPFITGSSSKALKEFASEMQKVSNYGDEELIPMMANLVSLGRTESETMKIMAVAMDMSAGMGISLDSAITQLNATLNGNIGRLGQQNAELKDLTEEELKQGKAVEILGEKFKGLSGATADTSKQLQNIKGDFKEALGQFTLPSSDMWNKFWAGFYERGIEVINKLNAFIDAQTIGKKTSSFLVEQLAPLEYYGDRIKYLRDSMHLLADDELQALGNYLSGLKNITEEQKLILNFVEQEKLRRKDLQTIEKTNAELKKAKADAEAQATAEMQKQEEIAKKKTDWESKLLDQRIEMLETEKEKAIANAEEVGEETYSIQRYYNDLILELKLERLENEKQQALSQEGLSAEDKLKVEEYYSNEEKKIYDELGDYKKKKGKEEERNEKSKFVVMLEYAKQYARKIKEVFSKVVNGIKTVFSTGINIFKKLFEINPDEILNNILKVEDSILTFFVETLPKLPNLVASIIQSIAVLAGNVRNVLRSSDVRNIILSILNSISSNLPQIVKDVLAVMKEIVSGLVEGLSKWVKSGGWKILLDLMLEIQKTLEEIVIDNIDEIAEIIADMMPDLVNMLVKSIVSASKTVGKIIKPILRIVGTLIEAILKVITSQEVINASLDAIGKIIEATTSFIIGNLLPIIIKIINALIKIAPQVVPKVIDAVLNSFANGFGEGLSNFFQNIDWGDVFRNMVTTLNDIARKFVAMLTGGVSEVGMGITSGSSSGYGKHSTGSTVGDVVVDLFTGAIRHLFADGTNTAPSGLAIVGEAGPELVRFRGGEQVLNNRNTNKALANMGGNTNNFNVTFNNLKDTSAFTMMQQLKAYNRQMAINSII